MYGEGDTGVVIGGSISGVQIGVFDEKRRYAGLDTDPAGDADQLPWPLRALIWGT